jgi:phosphate transport system substrate-binding protein
VNLAFNTTIGSGSSVPWRAGIGAPGNAGVAGAIRNTRGAIGYVEYAYATENNMQTPQLQNRSGAWVRPSSAAFAAAAATANWANAPNMAASMINTAGQSNWPIVSASYILLPRNPADAARSRKVMQFFDWAFRNGQGAADGLHYVMLPEAVRNQVRQRWCQVRSGNSPVWTGCH